MSSDAGLWGAVSSDAELIAAVRAGDNGAFAELYERHSPAARAVARQYASSAADAEDITSDAFAKVFAVVQGGGGPDAAFRAYLFTVVRRLAYASAQGSQRVQPTDDVATFESAYGPAGSVEEPALEGFERSVVARAYNSLPERWQAVLWYSEVEGLSAAQIAPLLGLSANGVAALSYRAREGLREAYLQGHLSTAPSAQCEGVAGKLGTYVRGGLSARDKAAVDAHLEGCTGCRALVLELGDVNHGMRAVVAPLVLGIAGLGALAPGGLGFGGLLAGLVGAGAGAGSGAAGVAGSTTTGGSAGGSSAASASGAGASGAGAGGAGAGATGAGAAGAGGVG
ncbi:MAG: sigma-70 family RNA polymerase sigma factor, partial [Actinomycetota bacterium]|nr:sigma-70 family RNA polymerase sigma factor [Actinomycetota bacterium]